jgi:dolichyl-phosphate beta-glucosyltransferase
VSPPTPFDAPPASVAAARRPLSLEERRDLGRAFARRHADASPWLTMVVPAYEEEARILPTLLSAVLHLRGFGLPFEVIVVDDGSRDGTARVVRAFAGEHPELRLLSFPRNRGKGAAVRAGMQEGRGAWLLMNDADGATPVTELERLLVAADAGADVVVGSRAVAATDVRVERRVFRHVVGRAFARLARWLAVPGIADTQCGFKLFRRNAAKEIFSRQALDRFGFDVEALFLARRLGFEIAEVPVSWHDVEGSKVSLLAGADGFLDILRVRWIHRGLRPPAALGRRVVGRDRP